MFLQESSPSGGGSTWLMLALMAVVVYFFMILPQTRKNKALKKFKEQLQNGQRVITNGGIHGKIVEMKETSCVIDAGGNTKFKIEKSGINMEATRALQESGTTGENS